MSELEHERRTARRIPRKESVSVQIVRADDSGEGHHKILDTVTVDISQDGMRLLLTEALEPELIFDLCVEINNEPKRFVLICETCWCRPLDQRRHEVGVRILDGDATDYDAWCAHFSN